MEPQKDKRWLVVGSAMGAALGALGGCRRCRYTRVPIRHTTGGMQAQFEER